MTFYSEQAARMNEPSPSKSYVSQTLQFFYTKFSRLKYVLTKLAHIIEASSIYTY